MSRNKVNFMFVETNVNCAAFPYFLLIVIPAIMINASENNWNMQKPSYGAAVPTSSVLPKA